MIHLTEKNRLLIAGVMSGTSADGIDVALVRIEEHCRSWELITSHAASFEEGLRERILEAALGKLSARETFHLDADLGHSYAEAVSQALVKTGLKQVDLDLVGLHGQTIYHNPKRLPNGVTVQIGSSAIVAERLRTVVVDSFRGADVAAGGEGAPFVPFCDVKLLHDPNENRVALNVGGISNITWLPANLNPEHVVAFDTGPGNMLIDAAMEMINGSSFDEGGKFAESGLPDEQLLESILADQYFSQPPPKSSGREHFSYEYAENILRRGRERGLPDASIVATLTLLTARSIAMGVRSHASTDHPVDRVIVSGGGWRNLTLMNMLADEFPEAKVVSSDEFGLPGDAKEAICFGILAEAVIRQSPNTLPSVTGASRATIGGAIHFPG